MKGALNPTQQLQVLSRIWGPDTEGYVFLPWIDGKARTRDDRRKGYHEGRAFAWPADKPAILEHLSSHPNDDLYFTPGVFLGKRRIESNLDAERCLWADLDPSDPNTLGDLRPTIAWESSPGRYQGVWILDTTKEGASWPGNENHRLSLAVNADPSGWDSTQLLRVPGRKNHKPEYVEANSGPVEGILLWDNGPRYTWSDFDDLPEVGLKSSGDTDFEEGLLKTINRHEVWGRVRLKVSHQVREYMAARDTTGADRSDVLWQIERDLADAGCTVPEIIAVVRDSIWNKYKGRSNEIEQLKKEAQKAFDQRPTDTLEQFDQPIDQDITWLADVAAQPIPRPRWLVRDIWTRGACGFISGAPKSYKSWMGLDMALSISSGLPFLGQPDYTIPNGPEPVLYLQEEDNLGLVMERLANILEGKDPQLHYHGYLETDSSGRVVWSPPSKQLPVAVHVQTGFISSDPMWQAWLEDKVSTHGFSMIIIDTLGTTVGDVDTDRSSDLMSKMLKPLKQIAQMHDVAICIIHHNKKDDQGVRAGRAMLGATALHAWVDCAIYARSKDTNGVVVIERETKQAPDLSLRLKIPFMYADMSTGERVLWGPQVVAPDVSEEQPATAPDDPHTGYVKGSHRESSLNSKLKGAGGTRIRQDILENILEPREYKQLQERISRGEFEFKDGYLIAK